jgi:hypothetical protein
MDRKGQIEAPMAEQCSWDSALLRRLEKSLYDGHRNSVSTYTASVNGTIHKGVTVTAPTPLTLTALSRTRNPTAPTTILWSLQMATYGYLDFDR